MSKRGNVATRKGTRVDGTLVAGDDDSDGSGAAAEAEDNPLKEINPKLYNELTQIQNKVRNFDGDKNQLQC